MVKYLILGGSNPSPHFWRLFADYANSRTGAEFHVVCFDEIKANDYRDQGFKVSCFEHIMRSYGQHEEDIVNTETFLRQFEKQTGTLLMDLIQADRHLGRGHFPGGTGHPKSVLSDIRKYEHTARLVKKYILTFDDLLDEYSPSTILMSGVASLPLKTLCVCARNHKVELRNLRTARVNNRYFWTINEFSDVPQLADAFENQVPAQETLNSAYDSHKKNREKFSHYASLRGVADLSFHHIKQYLAHHLYRDNTSPNRYKFPSKVRTAWNRFRDHRSLINIADDRETTKRDPYFFYPLQVEPEGSLMVHSQEFNNQQALIDIISKSLPAGYKLVVKEHVTAIGRRPKRFYPWLDALSNVMVASPHSSGRKLAQDSVATVTITSTAGLEASVAGVPVITPGQHNMYNLLDHVYQTVDFDEIRNISHRVINSYENNPEEIHTRRRDGQRLLAAIKEISFDLGDDMLSDATNLSDKTIELIYQNFISSVS